MDIHSFEFALLSFTLLEQWVFAEDDWLKEKRQELLKAREHFVKLQTQGGDAAELAQLRVLFPYLKGHNLEQSSAELLYQITRNTGYETNKGKLGECFIADCCKWALRQADDLCGLDHTRLPADEKKKLLVSCSILKTVFEKAGL